MTGRWNKIVGTPARWIGRRLGVVAVVAFAFTLGLCLASGGDAHRPAGSGDSDAASAAPAARPAVWTCPMHAQIRKPGPGACPLCGMDLIEVEAASGDGEGESDGDRDERITLNDRAKTLARIRTEPVRAMGAGEGAGERELRLLGRIAYDESRVRTVTSWIGGRIDQLRVATTGRTISAQQTIARLYSPEIYAAHSDLIQARKHAERLAGPVDSADSTDSAGPGDSAGSVNGAARRAAEAALAAAEQRLRLLGVPERDIVNMRAADSPARHIWIRTPFAGTVIERLVNEGNYVEAGAPLYRVVDLSRVWVQLDAYETDLPMLALGNRVSLSVVGLPDRVFTGQVSFIDPVVDMGTRTVELRVEVSNKDRALRPGMFAEAVLHSEGASATRLVIPRTAPLFTGVRSLVYVEIADAERPTYEAREVLLGPRTGEFYPVLDGLAEGERVVVRGAFVIDADLQIRGGASMMSRDDDVVRERAADDDDGQYGGHHGEHHEGHAGGHND